MATLGDFGRAREPLEDASFGWFGADIRVHPDVSNLVWVDTFGRQDESTFGDKMRAIRGVVDVVVHPADVEEFWRLARENRQTQDDVLRVAFDVVGALAERPTLRPSDSSDGSPPTEVSSTASPSGRAALRLLEGRPDLQVAVRRAEREREAPKKAKKRRAG